VPANRVLDRLMVGVAAPEELFREVRLLLETLARERPVVLHIDDLQWAEPMLLDLLDHVVDYSRGAPVLVLCSARPLLLENRPTWGGGKLNATALNLEPLPVEDCEALLDQLDDHLEPQMRARVVATSEGNPLFLEEMTALARERGAVSVPPTIAALLAARLEQLDPAEREVLQCAAVEGEVFHRSGVRALIGGKATDLELETRIAGLVRKELVHPRSPTLVDDDAFRFRHLLVRDAAYDALPKAARADLHERFADWLDRGGRDLADRDEITGLHLERAVAYRRELGQRVDPSLSQRAAEHLNAGGRRARRRSDVFASIGLFERARALAQTGESEGPDSA